ncbi:hypothetical protein NPS53_08705 [Pseudomonas putida]|uniref:hypothetical protein n=1 Tax=Pseudomonas putida TaxID=303 RepID=UPI0023648BFC|nr:hypothetical protein [Pseudomonas putida]MDD2139653.1 hypothetical protein [Pseudomonas putida]HDS1721577.1 hypothetical protein [Pseudomonas putida]
MNDQQLSFLCAEPTAFDVNAVDDAVVRPGTLDSGAVASQLSQRAVDDWVLGLGFTNWKTLLDHALQSGHYELYNSDDGSIGLRKHGYRYAPIPQLPTGGSMYVQQRLLMIAATRNAGRQDKMIAAGPGFAHKVVVEGTFCDLTVKQDGQVIRAGLQVDDLAFGDLIGDTAQLVEQLCSVLIKAGAASSVQLNNGCKSIALHISRIAHGVR